MLESDTKNICITQNTTQQANKKKTHTHTLHHC